MGNERSYSLLISVYAAEQPEFLDEALESIVRSSEGPNEVVLVEDGPIGERLQEVISGYQSKLPMRRLRLKSNQGLAAALNFGLRACTHELVARFDSDDICLPFRFTRQLDFLLQNPDVAAVSCWVEEFDGVSGKVQGLRAPPASGAELARFARRRNPLNHPAVMYRLSAVFRAGGYHKEAGFEDYSLWIRLLMHGYKIANLPTVLVRMRAGVAQTHRRSGWSYAVNEARFAVKFYRLGYFSVWETFRFVAVRFPLRIVAAPFLQRVYQRFGRVSSMQR